MTVRLWYRGLRRVGWATPVVTSDPGTEATAGSGPFPCAVVTRHLLA
ncbi:MAG: hypothetical protein ACP5OV_02150 [Acidimicrobiales bacterium]